MATVAASIGPSVNGAAPRAIAASNSL